MCFRAVVLRCVERLLGPAAELFVVAAVAGRRFDVEVVADVASIGVDMALAVLDSVIVVGLIEEDWQWLGWFRFTDVVVVQVLYESTGVVRGGCLGLRIGVAAGRGWVAGWVAGWVVGRVVGRVVESVRHRLLVAVPAATR